MTLIKVQLRKLIISFVLRCIPEKLITRSYIVSRDLKLLSKLYRDIDSRNVN